MKGLNRAEGYTIVETMFFLVITATLLVSGILVFSGRAARSQYTQAIRESDQRIRTIINEVGSGYFPSADFACSNPNDNAPLNIPGNTGSPIGSDEQGTRADCIFLGKAIHFKGNEIIVYTLAGARKHDGSNVTSIAEAKPQVVENLTQTYRISSGIEVYKTIQPAGNNCDDTSSDDDVMIAYLQSLGATGSGGDPISGAQTTEPYIVCDTITGALNSADSYRSPTDEGLKICIGEENARHGSITMAAQSQIFGTTTIIDDDSEDCK